MFWNDTKSQNNDKTCNEMIQNPKKMMIHVMKWNKIQKYAVGKMEWNRYGIVWNLGTMCILIYNIESLYKYQYIQNYYILWSGRAYNLKGAYCTVNSLITGSI